MWEAVYSRLNTISTIILVLLLVLSSFKDVRPLWFAFGVMSTLKAWVLMRLLLKKILTIDLKFYVMATYLLLSLSASALMVLRDEPSRHEFEVASLITFFMLVYTVVATLPRIKAQAQAARAARAQAARARARAAQVEA
jgi:hypothetical protein